MSEFISEDELRTFDGWLRYQGVAPATLSPGELQMWREIFEENERRRQATPAFGQMKLRPIEGEQRYGVVIRDGPDLWLTMWVRCAPRGDVYVMYPRSDRSNPHASYHRDGTFHHKSHNFTSPVAQGKRQPLAPGFAGSEHFGSFGGHGKSTGAICDPSDFDGVVAVAPGILGPVHGSVVVDLVEPGSEPRPDPAVHQRQIFYRGDRPSVVITIARHDQVVPFLRWPEDFVRAVDRPSDSENVVPIRA